MATKEFRAAEKHGAFTEPFPNVFMIQAGFRISAVIGITRNMYVVRQGDELTVISTARLSEEGHAELDKLGKVKHVVRIGGFHGADDPYYLHRYKDNGVTFWAPPKLTDAARQERDLVKGECPIEGAEVFSFENGKMPEAALVLRGGLFVCADAYQNWTTFEGCSLVARIAMPWMGFGPTHIGAPWLKSQTPSIRKDFERLIDVEFTHLLPGHGTVLKDDAKAGLRKAMSARFK